MDCSQSAAVQALWKYTECSAMTSHARSNTGFRSVVLGMRYEQPDSVSGKVIDATKSFPTKSC